VNLVVNFACYLTNDGALMGAFGANGELRRLGYHASI